MERGPVGPPSSRRSAKRLDRRSAIRLLGIASAAATLAPRRLAGAPETLDAGTGLRPLATGTVPSSLTVAELRTLERAVDRILPPTETPGAADAGVHWYLDDVARFEPELREALQQIAVVLDERCWTRFERGFAAATPEQQDDVLTGMLEGAKEDERLFATLKRETVRAYYRSEIGQVGELGWVGHEFHASFPGACPHVDPLTHPRPSLPRGRGR
jgi:hypothetical protein